MNLNCLYYIFLTIPLEIFLYIAFSSEHLSGMEANNQYAIESLQFISYFPQSRWQSYPIKDKDRPWFIYFKLSRMNKDLLIQTLFIIVITHKKKNMMSL